jgi:hypothetical protein
VTTAPRSLRSQNLAWLCAVTALDVLILVVATYPGIVTEVTESKFAWMRLTISGASPVLVLLLSSLLSAQTKAVIVFWRLRDTLPGHRAFSKHAQSDPRIDLAALRANVGTFPHDAREQNAAWYRLYKEVESDVIVAQAHRHYLLFRDLAAISLLLVPVAVGLLWVLGARVLVVWSSGIVFLVQYAAAACAARQNGVRFVTNVLTLHAVSRRK